MVNRLLRATRLFLYKTVCHIVSRSVTIEITISFSFLTPIVCRSERYEEIRRGQGKAWVFGWVLKQRVLTLCDCLPPRHGYFIAGVINLRAFENFNRFPIFIGIMTMKKIA